MKKNWNMYPTPRDKQGNVIPIEHRIARGRF